jgi:flagellar biosynthesis GTPase FlhF
MTTWSHGVKREICATKEILQNSSCTGFANWFGSKKPRKITFTLIAQSKTDIQHLHELFICYSCLRKLSNDSTQQEAAQQAQVEAEAQQAKAEAEAQQAKKLKAETEKLKEEALQAKIEAEAQAQQAKKLMADAEKLREEALQAKAKSRQLTNELKEALFVAKSLNKVVFRFENLNDDAVHYYTGNAIICT